MKRGIEIPPHICGHHCLGPLSFHKEALGAKLTLSHGAMRVERNRETFQNGVAFSSQPVSLQEKVHLRVESCDQHWCGSLRLGFTSIPPLSGPLFPPALAIPDLTTTQGYWLSELHATSTMPGSELRFWVTHQGVMVYEGPDGKRYRLLEGVDVTRPLWAIIDVYGQTRAVMLLGSEKKGLRTIRRSCPVPPPPPVSHEDSCMCVLKGQPCRTPRAYRHAASTQTDTHTGPDWAEDCAVCLSASAQVTLPCGHRCLCNNCAGCVAREFGYCPLCRQPINSPQEEDS